jgi:hypothetical protein
MEIGRRDSVPTDAAAEYGGGTTEIIIARIHMATPAATHVLHLIVSRGGPGDGWTSPAPFRESARRGKYETRHLLRINIEQNKNKSRDSFGAAKRVRFVARIVSVWEAKVHLKHCQQ